MFIKNIVEYANVNRDSIHHYEIRLVVEDNRFVLKDITCEGLANADLVNWNVIHMQDCDQIVMFFCDYFWNWPHDLNATGSIL